jgi:hypothetical protein
LYRLLLPVDATAGSGGRLATGAFLRQNLPSRDGQVAVCTQRSKMATKMRSRSSAEGPDEIRVPRLAACPTEQQSHSRTTVRRTIGRPKRLTSAGDKIAGPHQAWLGPQSEHVLQR